MIADTTGVTAEARDRKRSVALIAGGVLVLAASIAGITKLVDWASVAGWMGAHAVPIASLVLALALVVAGLSSYWRRGGQRPVRPTVALSWWIVAAAGAVVTVVAWGSTAWLLSEASRANDVPAARIEAIKTGLGIGAGTGGVFALLLAVRRQWHQEVTGASTEHDAAERRVTELYTKAVEQLGSDKAPVRLGGMYALERRAQTNSTQRRTVVNVLCAYLRMPFDFEELSGFAGYDDFPGEVAEELQVRLTAQAIVANRLRGRQGMHIPDSHNITIDLTGARLVNFNLAFCRLEQGIFDNARFTGPAEFDFAEFHTSASFRSAEFEDRADFTGARFRRSVFVRASFKGGADFRESVFEMPPNFGFIDPLDSEYERRGRSQGEIALDGAWVYLAYPPGDISEVRGYLDEIPRSWRYTEGDPNHRPDDRRRWQQLEKVPNINP